MEDPRPAALFFSLGSLLELRGEILKILPGCLPHQEGGLAMEAPRLFDCVLRVEEPLLYKTAPALR